jgi:hypothetical protein
MDHSEMTHRNIFTDACRQTIGNMDYRPVLKVRSFANHDGLDISPQHGAGPNARP